eukprot:CAMPEP_0204068770 /NCGR_PEP_ID=MMETSP0360-20130528/155857_1 /ASSEMBLY_ACC=CAM_ASM_000342 /TAXON_ID=268821 /ORGANISM="Scrippsiella Hangoei, Strain SHTV-5" /LENGTH=51 /DNA_ID=CAMNT_0051016917 /DNA_START=32 /DNA_END=188 /DNA_ORIENTATION=-
MELLGELYGGVDKGMTEKKVNTSPSLLAGTVKLSATAGFSAAVSSTISAKV